VGQFVGDSLRDIIVIGGLNGVGVNT